MPVYDNMTIDERRKYLDKMQSLYQAADKAGRGRLLDEMEHVTKLHRKSLIRLLGGSLERQKRTTHRPPTYGPMVAACVQQIVASFDDINAERVHPKLVERAEALRDFGEIEFTDETLALLKQMSRSTLERMLHHLHQDDRRLSRRHARPTNLIAARIPAGRLAWDLREPGHFEVDLVYHSGPNPSGEFMHTLQLIDVATGWSERVPVLGRSYLVMRDAFCRILERLPFPIRQLHPDNGPEFLNAHLQRFWQEYIPHLRLSRSRGYHKNDNPHVEQSNYSLVRRLLGYGRFDSVAQTNVANAFYEQRWLFDNFFQPVTRQIEKSYVLAEDGSLRVKRRHDTAQTPLERLCASGVLMMELRDELLALRARTNPAQLLRGCQALQAKVLRLPGAQEGQSEDVTLTLAYPEHYAPIPRAVEMGTTAYGAVAHISTAPATVET